MPKKLEDCVSDLKAQGKSESEAYAICAKSTGWVRKKGGGWKNTKTGETFNESFLWMFTEGVQQTLDWLKATKGLRNEINKLKNMLSSVDTSNSANNKKVLEIRKAIEYLEKQLKG
jgi:hypothetical protein